MTNQSELEQLKQDAQQALQELEATMHKVSVYGYNMERSFTDNCKEISGKGLTAEEARIKWGLKEVNQ